jgi:ABC-2 type transport system permease protein
MLTYATVALLMSLILEVDGTRIIRDKVREGTIATDLMKPIDLPLYFFSEGFGQTTFHALTILPSLLLALLFVHIDVPGIGTLAVFGCSFVLGYFVNFFLNFLMNSVAFWTLETFAIQLMVRWASDFLGGQLLPLTFFPGALGWIVERLPFAAVYSTRIAYLHRRVTAIGLGRRNGGSSALARALCSALVRRVARGLAARRRSGRLRWPSRTSI